jgi:hypothetical protein
MPYKFCTKITVGEYDIKMPCGIRKGVTNTKTTRNETQESIRRTRAMLKMAHDRTRMETKRKQAMLKKKQKQKTSTKDDMDKDSIQRKNVRTWDKMMSGGHATGEKFAPCDANTNNYEEAIKRILRRSDKDALRGASYKTKKNGAVRRALNKKSRPREMSQTARGMRTLNTNFSTTTGGGTRRWGRGGGILRSDARCRRRTKRASRRDVSWCNWTERRQEVHKTHDPATEPTQITPQQIEAEAIAKPNSGLNTNLRATTTWNIQNNDEKETNTRIARQCVEYLYTLGGQVSRAHTENDRKKRVARPRGQVLSLIRTVSVMAHTHNNSEAER